jgi:prolyl 4-hydroxylase
MAQLTMTFADVESLAQAGRLQEAFELILALAENGDGEALFTLGSFYWQGGPVDQDPVRGRELFVRASQAGHPMARMFVTNLMGNGIAGERDWAGALGRLKQEVGLDPHRELILRALSAMVLDEEGDPAAMPDPKRLSDRFDAFLYQGLFTQDECKVVLSAADRRFMPSTIHDSSGREVPHPLRSSSGAPLHWLIEDPALHALNRRLAAATGTGYDQAEPLLVLKYEPGQQYRPHFDALPGLENQRIATALVYLNSGYSGGETVFPRIGVQVAGQPGDVLVFRNTLADGAADPLSEHAGLPVISGVKYLATRWIRARRNIP